jgi:hypothetical protein
VREYAKLVLELSEILEAVLLMMLPKTPRRNGIVFDGGMAKVVRKEEGLFRMFQIDDSSPSPSGTLLQSPDESAYGGCESW